MFELFTIYSLVVNGKNEGIRLLSKTAAISKCFDGLISSTNSTFILCIFNISVYPFGRNRQETYNNLLKWTSVTAISQNSFCRFQTTVDARSFLRYKLLSNENQLVVRKKQSVSGPGQLFFWYMADWILSPFWLAESYPRILQSVCKCSACESAAW